MSVYKLYYFKARAVAEPIRFMLSYMGKSFEDVRIELADWPALKPQMPFGRMPVLEKDGVKYHQSIALCRYLARQVDLAGKDDNEALNIDMAVDTFQDFRLEISKYYFEENKEKKEQIKKKLTGETIPFYMNKFEQIIKHNGGFIANKSLSWGDIYIAAFADTLSGLMGFDIYEDRYPNFTAMKNSVFELPGIKAWVEKRPETFC